MAGVLFGALLVTAFKVWLDSDDAIGHDNKQGLLIGVTITIFILVGVGSAWAWSVAKRSREARPKARMKLMLFGWMLAFGLGSFAVWLVMVLGVLFQGFRVMRDDDFVIPFFVTLVLSALALPGSSLLPGPPGSERRSRSASASTRAATA